MNTSNIMGALFPIFFVLALGYLAGKRNTFDADQAASACGNVNPFVNPLFLASSAEKRGKSA